jgi:hypothetical protein
VDVAPKPAARRGLALLRRGGFFALVGGLVLAGVLLGSPGLRNPWSWSTAGVLVLLGLLPVFTMRPRPLLTTYSALALGSLVAYLVVVTPTQREAIAASAPAPAPYSQPPAAVAPPKTPPPPQRPALGVSTPTIADLDAFIRTTKTHPQAFDVFESWAQNRPLDRYVADSVALRGARLSITWEPWIANDGAYQRNYTLNSITNGSHDAYIDMFARSVKAFRHPVTIRLMHEMNGNWYPWGLGVNGNRKGDYVRAWRHVHDRFAALGVTNVAWMWAPNAVYPGGASLAPLYPGDAYVDEVGISNYNWGDFTHDGSTTQWATFGQLFDESIRQLRALTHRPLWIAETGSSDKGGNKAAWVAQTLAAVSARPEIAGVMWFDQVDHATRIDWRIEKQPAVVAAWRTGYLNRPRA